MRRPAGGAAPRVVENPPGQRPGAYLLLEGVAPVHLAQGMGAGKKPEELPQFFQASTYKDGRLRPSEYFRRQVFATFIDDRVGVASREFIGVENIRWSSDYPHTVSTWPHSREVVERDFKDVPELEKRRIVRANVARLYNLALA